MAAPAQGASAMATVMGADSMAVSRPYRAAPQRSVAAVACSRVSKPRAMPAATAATTRVAAEPSTPSSAVVAEVANRISAVRVRTSVRRASAE